MATVKATAPERIEIIDENLKNGYIRMPRPVLKARGLSSRAKCLYCLLLDYAWQQASCFPGQETMADDLDTSLDTIQRGLQELRDYGLIDWKRHGLNRPNTYYILRLSECARLLRMMQPEPPTRDTAEMPSQTPHSCGLQKPQECGRNQTKSKKISESDEDSSRNSCKEKDEVDSTDNHGEPKTIRNPSSQEETMPQAASSSRRKTAHTPPSDPSPPHRDEESKHETSGGGGTGHRPRQSFYKAQQKVKPLVTLEKPLQPLTQEEIDDKRRQGKNASGYTPLPGLISPDQWQQLEQQDRKAAGKPTATHFNVCTKNAPLMIDTTLEQFTNLLGDDPVNTAININRAAKLYRQAGRSEEVFREKLYEAFDQAKRYDRADIKKQRPDGRPNRMPVFFTILQERLRNGESEEEICLATNGQQPAAKDVVRDEPSVKGSETPRETDGQPVHETAKANARIPVEYQAALARLETLLPARAPLDKLHWMERCSGFPSGFVFPAEYLRRIRDCLASGDWRRIDSAVAEIERHLQA